MANNISIDTDINNLVISNAKTKILIRGEDDIDRDVMLETANMDNLYIVSYPDEILAILQFNLIERL